MLSHASRRPRQRHRPLMACALAVMLTTVLWLPGTASAGAVADTQVLDTSTCTTDAFFTLCFDDHAVIHTTLTPSGRSIGDVQELSHATATGVPGGPFEGCVSTTDVSSHGHFTDLGDINLISFTNLRGVATRTCGDPLDFDCTNTLHLQFIDGRVVIDGNTNVCRPV